jgi:hypothetical protein
MVDIEVLTIQTAQITTSKENGARAKPPSNGKFFSEMGMGAGN